jgi:hypothetical protein
MLWDLRADFILHCLYKVMEIIDEGVGCSWRFRAVEYPSSRSLPTLKTSALLKKLVPTFEKLDK